MNILMEQGFVEKFVNKQFKERINFELRSKKKRNNAIDRFSHDADLIIEKKYLVAKSTKFDEKEIRKYLLNIPIYVLSYKYSNGFYMSNEDAIDYLFEESSVVLLIFENICIIKSENEYNQAEYYILQCQG